MNFLTTVLFLIFAFIIGVLPFFILYGFSDFVKIILRYIVRYRVEVIQNNISRVFPDYSESQNVRLLNKFYVNLTDIFIEGIKSFAMTKKQIVKRHKLVNAEILDSYLTENKSLIGVTAHYNNWEWGSLSAGLQTPYKAVAFYKPIKNKYIDIILRKNRSRCGTELSSIYHTSQTFERNKNNPTLYLMAGDQSPSARELPKAYWVDFLGVKTAFLHGIEKHAKNNNYPVVYIDIQRKKRGYYELSLSVLSDNPRDLAEGELTKRYAQKLESIIRNEPANWLWSHKRWKHND